VIADHLDEVQHLEGTAEFQPDDLVTVGCHRLVMTG
jgi:hypothetical protein